MPFLIVFSMFISCDEDDKKLPFKYSHLGLHIIQTDKTALGSSLSVPLPGSLYVVLERKAEEIDNDDYSYERIINAARIGVHAGIADVLSSISSRGIKIIVKNIFDVYAELGIKSSAYENDINSFSEDDAKANVIAGIRFGNPIGWEGKLFIDFSKDAELKVKECPTGSICTQSIEYKLDDETDQKYGAAFTYNINNRNSVIIEMSSSKIFDGSLKLGYQFNF